MVLDTNAKKFKYSTINKIICVILCLATFCSSAWIASNTGAGITYHIQGVYNSEENTDDWTNSTVFYRVLWGNCQYIAQEITAPERKNYIKKEIKKNKQHYVDKIYKEVLNHRKEAEANPERVYDYDEYDDPVLSTTVVHYDEFSSDYELVIGGVSIDYINITGNTTKKDIENQIDYKVSNFLKTGFIETGYKISDGIDFFARLGENEISNTEDLKQKKIYDNPYYLVIKKGEAESKGINKTVVEDVVGSILSDYKYFDKADFYFGFTPQEQALSDTLSNAARNEDADFSDLYTFHIAEQKSIANAKRNIITAVLLLLLSIIFGFYYFSITGKRDEEQPARLAFYDYIPFELSLGIAGGLGFGAAALLISLADTVYLSMLTIYCIFLFAVACWILLFFVSSSFSRYIHSDKKFYKHLLTYWIFFAVWKLIKYGFVAVKWLLKQVAKWFSKTKKSARRTFGAFVYSPKHFKRNIILIAIGWICLNFVLLGATLICMNGSNGFGFVTVLADVVMNFFAIRKVAEYMGNLDKIIDAASRHEEVLLDIDTLDLSLQILAESMRYTNSELQNAIAKAVKDERLRTELITNVSHDLKTPLTSIITYVDLLSKCDIDDPKAIEYISVLDDKGARLKRLIDDLIEASKVTSGNVTVNLAPMNLSELCLQSTIDAQSDFDKAGLELVIKQGEKPTIVVADGTKANRVIENLLSNARKYSAKGSRVYVQVYQENGCGVFEIKNISAQPLDITPDELTERFVRGDESRNQEGNGLGLSIAKELCSLQNGELELIIDGDLFKARVKLPTK